MVSTIRLKKTAHKTKTNRFWMKITKYFIEKQKKAHSFGIIIFQDTVR